MSIRSCALGCLSIVGVAVLGVALFAAAVWLRSSRLIAPSVHDGPVPIDGACPTDEVVAWLEGSVERHLEGPLAPLNEALDRPRESGDPTHALADVDVESMRVRIDALANEQVPACLEAMRDEMLRMPRSMANAAAYAKEPATGPSMFRTLVLMTVTARSTSVSVERIRDARERLSQRLGVDLDAGPGDEQDGPASR